MGFFSKKQKYFALSKTKSYLEDNYHRTEKKLKRVSLTGDETKLKNAMSEHGDFEYALLYRNTPEYKKQLSKIYCKR